MALSGSFKGSYQGWHIRTEWSATQSIANNTSTVTCNHYLDCDKYYSIEIGNRSNTSVIDGSSYTFTSPSIYHYETGPKSFHLGTTSKTIKHNADGSKSFSMSTTFYLKATLSGVYKESVTGSSGTITLNKIPRQANITAADNFNDEGNPTVTYSNPAGSAVDALDIAIYNSTGSTAYAGYRAASKTGTSYTFTLTDAERTALRKAATGNTLDVRFYLRTNLGGTNYFSYIDKTMTITNGNPTLNPTVVDSNATTKALTGDANKLVKYYSNAAYTIGAAAVKNASLSSQKVTHNGISKTTATGTYNAVEGASFTFEAKDSRGNTTTKTITKTLIDYVKLTCNQKIRISADGVATIDINGNYFNGSFGAVANTLTVQYRYKTSGGTYSAWTDVTASKSGNTYTATATKSGLNYQTTYVFQCRAIDKINTGGVNTEERTIKALPVFDWGENDFHIHGNLVVEGTVTYSNAAAASTTLDEAVDTIIEYGNNGSYGYKKWSSGLLEAWRTATSAVSVTSGSASGAIYYTDQVSLKTNGYASQFVSLENVQITVNKNGAIGLWQPVIARTSVADGVASVDVFFTNGVKDATASIVPYVYFIGRWK